MVNSFAMFLLSLIILHLPGSMRVLEIMGSIWVLGSLIGLVRDEHIPNQEFVFAVKKQAMYGQTDRERGGDCVL